MPRYIGLRLRTWDVNGSSPVQLGQVDYTNTAILKFDAFSVRFVPGSTLIGVAGDQAGLLLFDVVNPASPAMVKILQPELNNGILLNSHVTEWISDGRYIWVFAQTGNTQPNFFVWDLGFPSNVTSVLRLPPSTLPTGRVIGAVVDPATRQLFFTTLFNGNLFAIDISTPTAPLTAVLSQIALPRSVLGSDTAGFSGFFGQDIQMTANHLIIPAPEYTAIVNRNVDGTLGSIEYVPTHLGASPGGDGWIDNDVFVIRSGSAAERWYICGDPSQTSCSP